MVERERFRYGGSEFQRRVWASIMEWQQQPHDLNFFSYPQLIGGKTSLLSLSPLAIAKYSKTGRAGPGRTDRAHMDRITDQEHSSGPGAELNFPKQKKNGHNVFSGPYTFNFCFDRSYTIFLF